jgi:hypothetical protein
LEIENIFGGDFQIRGGDNAINRRRKYVPCSGAVEKAFGTFLDRAALLGVEATVVSLCQCERSYFL